MKKLGLTALGVAIFAALLLIPAVVFLGIAWASTHVLPTLITVGWVALILDVLILLPLSIFKRLRGFTGGAIFVSSYLFGLVTFLLGVVVTWMLWGGWAVAIGILMFGGAVVPFALAAALFNGMWSLVLTILILCALTFGARFLGVMLAESGARARSI